MLTLPDCCLLRYAGVHPFLYRWTKTHLHALHSLSLCLSLSLNLCAATPLSDSTPPTVQEGWLERVSYDYEQERQNDPIDQASMRASGRNPFVRSVGSEAMRGMERGISRKEERG